MYDATPLPAAVVLALRLVLQLERVPCLPIIEHRLEGDRDAYGEI
jgi:hypothetical protein